jgi:hypothetical protein
LSLWKLHWLEATGDLSEWYDCITEQVEDAYIAMKSFVQPTSMDILIEKGNGNVTPETGMRTDVIRPNLAKLVFDNYNENFSKTLTTTDDQYLSPRYEGRWARLWFHTRWRNGQ